MSASRRLGLVLATALVLRLALALQGGQYFFGDEGRHQRGIGLYLAAAHGDMAGIRAVLAQPEHAAFTWLAALLAGPQHLLAGIAGHGDWTDPANPYASAPLAAALLAGSSVLGLALVYRLARLGGADETEALWATGLAAASNTLFYYSRHLLPYDAALACWLGSLCLAHRPGTGGAMTAGALAGLTFHFYNGYWFLPPLAGLWLLRLPNLSPVRATRWVAGTFVGLGLPILVGWAAGGAPYWQTFAAFSGTVRQGLFAEGWTLPWAYLAHSEGWLGLLVPLAVGGAATVASPPARVRLALLAVAAICLLLGLMSAGAERFVVYARSVRPLVPLFCLAGGWAIAVLLRPRPALASVAAAALTLGAATAFTPHFLRSFPREIERQILLDVGKPKLALSFSGPFYRPLALPVTRPDLVLVNAGPLYPLRAVVGYPTGQVLLSLPHPLTFAPFQYEGHTPRERALLRQHPPAIRLIRLAEPAAQPNYPPPGQLFDESDQPDGYDRHR